MATLEDLNARLQDLQERQIDIDGSTPSITPGNGVTDITEAVNTTTAAVDAANVSKNTAAQAAASAAGYANSAKTARDEAAASASAAADDAISANSSKSAAATSATNAATSASNAENYSLKAAMYATTAQTAEADTLTAYEGALEAYAGSIDVLADVEAIRANTVEAWQNIQNSIYSAIEIDVSDEGDLVWANPASHKIYYSAGIPVTNLTVAFTDGSYTTHVADIQYITELHFISHSTIQSSYSDDLIYWSGNDCASGKFVPAGERVYDIVLTSNMERLRGYVSGTPALAATMSLRPTREEDPAVWVLYINETTVQHAPKYVVIDGTVYTNPDESRLTEAGYKPLLVDEHPGEEEGYYIDSIYEDTEDAVLQHWTKIPVEVPAESTEEDPEDVHVEVSEETPVEAPEEEPVEESVEASEEPTVEVPEEAPVDAPEEV